MKEDHDSPVRWKIFRTMALISVAVLVLLLVILRPLGHKLVVKAYFTNSAGLIAGATVRLAGVQIGSVKSVRVRPELREAPVEVVMMLTPPDELKIPDDSTLSLQTAGALGESYVEIDTSSASGPAVEANAVLRTTPTSILGTEQMINKLGDVLRKKNCDCDGEEDKGPRAKAAKKSPARNPSH